MQMIKRCYITQEWTIRHEIDIAHLIKFIPKVRGCIQKFPDWVDNETNNDKHAEKKHKGFWRQKSLDW